MRWWMKFLAAAIIIALLVWLGWSMTGGLLGLLNGAELDASQPDPMFAREAEIPVRPPELDMEETAPERPTLDDYAPTEGAPVDKTVDELIREARQAAAE